MPALNWRAGNPARSRPLGGQTRLKAGCAGITFLLLPTVGASAALPESTERGRQIYFNGRPEVRARIGDSDAGARVASTAVPCARCHGAHGRDGVPEGGLAPPDITWGALTKPYEVTAPSGRKRQPYTEAKLRRAISMGFDSAGNPLHTAMPRYEMTYRSMQDLIAWMKILGDAPVPGVTATAIHIGVIVPAGAGGEAFRAALAAYAAEAGKQDGLFGRRLELDTTSTSEVLCVLADTFDAAAWTKEIPLIAASPILTPEHVNPFVFYLHNGVQGEVEALARHAAGGSAAVLYEPAFAALAAAVAQIRKGPAVRRVPVEQEETLFAARPDILFALAPGWKASVLRRHSDWRPVLYVPGSLASDALFDFPAIFAFPFLPSDRSAETTREYRALAASYSLPARYTAIQSRALAAITLLVKALRDTGRDVSALSLTAALERLRSCPLGYTPPVTFTANRHIGSLAMHLARFDPATGDWKPVD